MTTTRVAVAIAHAGEAERLAGCLASLRREPPVSEIVVTLPTKAESSRQLVDGDRRCHTVVTPRLLPFAVMTNLAVRASREPYVLLLNDDAEVTDGSVSRLAAYLDTHPATGAVAPLLRNPDGSLQPSLYRDPGFKAALEQLCGPLLTRTLARRFARSPRFDFPARPSTVDWASGAALLVRRAPLREDRWSR